jgi:phospholipase/carboxylesterase
MPDYTRQNSEAAVILNPVNAAQASVIWLHGLGADGNDFVPIVPELNLPAALAVRFIFPHAPYRPVTINNGYVMRAWYDIKALALQAQEDIEGVRASQVLTHALIQQQLEQGIAANKIVIAGFSQGGAIALQTALRYPQRLAGVMALSTYLPLRDSFAAELNAANRDLPILMCHGRQDPVVPLMLGELSREALVAQGLKLDFRTYDMPHSVCAEEVVDIAAWLRKVLAS